MFGFPKADKPEGFKYDKTYLRSVVFQIKFQPSTIFSDENVHEELKEYFKDQFKNSRKILNQEFEFKFKKSTSTLSTQSKKGENKLIGLELRNDKSTEILIFNADSISLTIQAQTYTCFNDYSEKIEQVFNCIPLKYGIGTTSRIAVRKTNILELSPKDDAELDVRTIQPLVFNNALIDHLSFFPSANFLKHNINSLSFANDKYELLLKYGLISQFQANIFPLLLDIDLFTTIEMPIDEVSNQFVLINDEIFNVFRWSLQDDVFNYLFKN